MLTCTPTKRRSKRRRFSPGDRQRNRAKARSRQQSVDVSEIGPPPERNEELWQRYQFDLLAYLVENFPHSTGLKPFSPDHERAIRKLQDVVLNGGQDLWLVYRGWAKSTICENTTTWATGYGHRKYFVNIGADKEAALMAVASVQSEFESNDRLMLIFPEVCHCARALEGVPQRAKKQTVNGRFTNIEWPTKHCVLPTIPGFAGSGARIVARGITSNMRGMRFKRPDGTQARPDFVLGDDLQTDQSAISPAQCTKRLTSINNNILRLGGHQNRMACMILGTPIAPDDVVDTLSKKPTWRVERVPMLRALPTALDSHWLAKYAELRTSHRPDDENDRARAIAEANEYLKANWDVMHAGAVASWEACMIEGEELSAVQHAINIAIDTTFDAFLAECQCDPQRNKVENDLPTIEELGGKIIGHARGVIPDECSILTAMADQQAEHFFWMVCGWTPDCTCHVIDYGAWPDQKADHFTRRSIRYKLSKAYPGDISARVFGGLTALEAYVFGKNYRTAGGATRPMMRLCVDNNWPKHSAATESWAKQSPHRNIITLTKGHGVGAKDRPFDQSERARKWKTRPAWFWQDGPGNAATVIFDTNAYKSRVLDAIKLPAGSIGGVTFFKGSRAQHQMLFEHLRAEYPVRVTARGRTVDEFKERPNQDNEGLDVLVGNFLAARIAGLHPPSERNPARPRRLPRQKVKYL